MTGCPAASRANRSGNRARIAHCRSAVAPPHSPISSTVRPQPVQSPARASSAQTSTHGDSGNSVMSIGHTKNSRAKAYGRDGWGADCQVLARKRLKLPFRIPQSTMAVQMVGIARHVIPTADFRKPQRASSVRALTAFGMLRRRFTVVLRACRFPSLAERSGYGCCPETGRSLPFRPRRELSRRRLRLAAVSRANVNMLPSGPSPAPLR